MLPIFIQTALKHKCFSVKQAGKPLVFGAIVLFCAVFGAVVFQQKDIFLLVTKLVFYF